MLDKDWLSNESFTNQCLFSAQRFVKRSNKYIRIYIFLIPKKSNLAFLHLFTSQGCRLYISMRGIFHKP